MGRARRSDSKRPGGATGPGSGCPATQPPVIHFAPIADQSGDLDYVIEARITDAESAIQEAFIAGTQPGSLFEP